jgi:hypothetical protein
VLLIITACDFMTGLWNHLPLHIKKVSNNVPLFKSLLKKLLLQYVFYSVDEYYQIKIFY